MKTFSSILFVGLSIFHAAPAAATELKSSSQVQTKQAISFNLIRLDADYENGKWNIDNVYRPVIKTSLTKRNYFLISNVSSTEPLNLVIPKIQFSVIAKNNVLFPKAITLEEESSGKEVLWIEPNSSLMISFTNDLANTPLQAFVAVTKSTKDVIGIFGPDQGSKFTLPSNNEVKPEVSYENLGLVLRATPKISNTPTPVKPGLTKIVLKPLTTYEIINSKNNRIIQLSDDVYVGVRNRFIGGSNYWAKKLTLRPGEKFTITTLKDTILRTKDE